LIFNKIFDIIYISKERKEKIIMKMKPIMVTFPPCNDQALSCPSCKEMIIFSIDFKKDSHLKLVEPDKCSHCGQEFDWE
jgi:transcription elongation factor Elf1